MITLARNMISVVNKKPIFKRRSHNVWEEFFEQPFNYGLDGLDDINGANKVTFSYIIAIIFLRHFSGDIFSLNNEELNRIKGIYKNTYA